MLVTTSNTSIYLGVMDMHQHIITCITDACISDARRHRSSIAPDERRHKSSPSSAEVLSSQQCTTGDLRRGNKMQANSECAPASGRV
jgi:hypothetical protein